MGCVYDREGWKLDGVGDGWRNGGCFNPREKTGVEAAAGRGGGNGGRGKLQFHEFEGDGTGP